MSRQWFYLDALNQPRGPISDAELDQLLRRADHYVFTEGLPEWTMGSELFADNSIVPLSASGPSHLDDHGQPRIRHFGAARRADRQINELLGIARGVIADGEVSVAEAHALARWLESNPDVLEVWPANVIAARLTRIFEDGHVDEEERGDLLALLQAATGERPEASVAMNGATRLPLCDPAPTLRFSGQVYVFTGKFAFGTRAACQQTVTARGGRCESDVNQKTNVLVIGTLGSENWAQSSFGRKIEKAVHYRANGVPVSIVSEEHWTSFLRV
jgi:BRCA1 C Terminus (BRCT) domain/GYF domain 2